MVTEGFNSGTIMACVGREKGKTVGKGRLAMLALHENTTKHAFSRYHDRNCDAIIQLLSIVYEYRNISHACYKHRDTFWIPCDISSMITDFVIRFVDKTVKQLT